VVAQQAVTASAVDAVAVAVESALETGRRILLVDDNEDAAELLGEFLRSLGHVTRIAHDGPAALRVVEGFPPDLALLDIGLPVMDGYELARRLRELPALAKVRLIAVTGYGQETDRLRSREAGFDAHLVKPVRLETLESLLHGLLEAGESRRSAGT
jgi:CheY-like chemotaxis protein